jgi:hypothetical protein
VKIKKSQLDISQVEKAITRYFKGRYINKIKITHIDFEYINPNFYLEINEGLLDDDLIYWETRDKIQHILHTYFNYCWGINLSPSPLIFT